MTVRRTAPLADRTAIATRNLREKIRAAADATETADAARVVRRVLADGTVQVSVAEAAPPPPSVAEVDAATRDRIRALRARLGGSARPVGRD